MLEVKGLSKNYVADGSIVQGAKDVTFEVPRGEIFTLLGPSGCGKTTTLRSIAGLETPDSGEIVVDKMTIYSSQSNICVPTNRRGFGMVFQSYAIWPHMTVYENAAFPLTVGDKRRQYGKKRVRDEVMRVLDVVALNGFENRRATQLSGGQQQRLALARAIIVEPPLLLLDEPLSNLDAKLREKMRFELKRLQHELGVTTVYVTHDQSEALALSHEIAVMDKGQIVQLGSPTDIYERPTSQFVAEFVGTTNFVRARISERGEAPNCWIADTNFGRLEFESTEAHSPGEELLLSARPEHIQVTDQPGQGFAWPATVSAQIFLGFHQDVEFMVNGSVIQARLHPSLRLQPGTNVSIQIDKAKCVVCR